MVKTDSKQDKAFAALLKKAESAYKGEAEAEAIEPIAELVISFLAWNATLKQAEAGFTKIMEQVVDLNELRVSHPHEIINMIGVRYPDADARVRRMLESMMEIYQREHDWKLTSIKSKGKREQRDYLDTLPGIPSYVAARVALLSFGAHAMPVDDKLADQLIAEDIFEPGTTPDEIESWMTRQIKAGSALQAHLALQQWSDEAGPAKSTSKKKTTKKTTKKKSTKKKSTKKTTTKKRVAKKK